MNPNGMIDSAGAVDLPPKLLYEFVNLCSRMCFAVARNLQLSVPLRGKVIQQAAEACVEEL